jgi:SAM-dependent methyltransferase
MTSPADDARAAARELAQRALSAGEPLRWFEELYAAADRGDAAVPWADLRPNPVLVQELPGLEVSGKRVLVVGCGYGDDAALLARAGGKVTAFDIAPSAVARCAERFGELDVSWVVADALAPDAAWARGFDLVVEVFTLQVLPPRERGRAGAALGGCVAPGGRLFAYCRGRDPDEPAGAMPWPLTADEVMALAADGLEVERFDDFLDGEEPPVRRFLALLRRNR